MGDTQGEPQAHQIIREFKALLRKIGVMKPGGITRIFGGTMIRLPGKYSNVIERIET